MEQLFVRVAILLDGMRCTYNPDFIYLGIKAMRISRAKLDFLARIQLNTQIDSPARYAIVVP